MELADNVESSDMAPRPSSFNIPQRASEKRRLIRPPPQVYEEDMKNDEEDEEELPPATGLKRMREEREEEEKEPPTMPAKTAHPFPYLSFALCLIVLACFSAVAGRMFFYQVPLLPAINGLLGLRPDVFPLWLEEPHMTNSRIAERSDRNLLTDVARSLDYHMDRARALGAKCLCAHHLRIGAEPLRVCQVGKILMINPTMIGNSKSESFYKETSVSCKEPSITSKRHSTIVLEWYDTSEQDVMYSKFSGGEALCMQLALDEMEGDKHC